MKGLIAPLLALMMTGMVFSQQPQSNSLSSVDSNDSQRLELLSRYLLVLTDDHVRVLQQYGELRPDPIEPLEREAIDHVVFHATEVNAKRLDLTPFNMSPTPSSDSNGILEFTLTDDLIDKMRRQGLKYIIRPADRGKYSQVIITNDRSTRSNSAFPSSRNRIDDQVRQSRNVVNQQPFIGPLLPNEIDEYNRRDRMNQAGSNPSFTPRLGSVAQRRNSSIDNNFDDRQIEQGYQQTGRNQQFTNNEATRNGDSRDFTRNSDVNQSPARAQRDKWSIASNNGFDSNRNARSYSNNDVIPRVDRNNDFMNNRPSEGDLRLDQGQRFQQNQSLRSDRITQDRLATEKRDLQQQLNEERYLREQRELQIKRERRARALADNSNRRSDAGYQYPYGNDGRLPIEYPSRQFPNRHESDFGDRLIVDAPDLDSYVTMPRRKAAAEPRPSNKPPAFAIPGVEDATSVNRSIVNPALTTDEKLLANVNRIQNQNQALWFIMLCSIGLNFYLAWISRGFYVRYEELADEIRETFTSSL